MVPFFAQLSILPDDAMAYGLAITLGPRLVVYRLITGSEKGF